MKKTVFEYLQSCSRGEFIMEIIKMINIPYSDSVEIHLNDTLLNIPFESDGEEKTFLKHFQTCDKIELIHLFVGFKSEYDSFAEKDIDMMETYFDSAYKKNSLGMARFSITENIEDADFFSFSTNKGTSHLDPIAPRWELKTSYR